MARQFSEIAIQAMNDPTGGGQVFLWLISLTHPDITPIHLVNNREPITSNGILHTAYPFSVILPSDSDMISGAQLVIDNVDRSLVDEIRKLTSPMTVSLKLVLFSNPDLVEQELPDMKLRKVSYTAQTITGNVTLDSILSVRFPAHRVTSDNYAAIY